MISIKTLLFLSCLLGSIPLLKAIEYPSRAITLKNGLKVIVCEKKENDFVEFEVWYRTGSKDEKPGIRGMAHLFEHMMFRGTEKFPGKSVFENVESVGGNVNAYTTIDRTVYHEYVPTSALEKMMDIESDRMANLVVTQEILNTEREVVGEELRMGMNNWYQKMMSERYPFLYPKDYPYEVDVIGFLPEITNFTAAQCMEFYNNFYSPNNAFVVVVGNVNTEEVFAMAEKYFGPITKQLNFAKNPMPTQIDTAKIRISEMKIDFPIQIYSYVFPSPSAENPDELPLKIALDLLFNNQNSILNERLVKRDHLAYAIVNARDEYQYFPAFKIIDVVMDAAPGNVKVKKIIREEINKIITNGVSKEMLDNYVTSTSNSLMLSNYETENIAAMLGSAEYYFNDYKKAYSIVEDLKKVSPDQIQAAAQKYLSEDRIQFINIKPE